MLQVKICACLLVCGSSVKLDDLSRAQTLTVSGWVEVYYERLGFLD